MTSSHSEQLNDQEIDFFLDRLVRQELSLQEAEEMLARLHVSRQLVSERLLARLMDPAIEHQDVIVVLLGYLGDENAVPPLFDLVNDASVADDYKLKLITLINQLDPNVDVDSLLSQLQDPYHTLQRSQREHLRQLQSPEAMALWLEIMEEQMLAEIRLKFCRALIDLDDATAVPLLICMCYDPDDEVALAAIDAVERFKDQRALPPLEELAQYHPSSVVCDEARKTADRLRIRAALVPQPSSTPSGPLYACYLTTVGGSGDQVALVVRERADDLCELVHVAFDDREGIQTCFGALMAYEGLEDALDVLAAEGLSPVTVSHTCCLNAIEMAQDLTWKAKRRLPMPFVAWRDMIEWRETPHTEPPPALAVPREEVDDLLKSCHELLIQDEFVSWLFAPDEIDGLIDEYTDADALGPIAAPALRHLLGQGVCELIDVRERALIRDRLRRTAPLLRELYEENEVWQWAVVAADALSGDGALSPEAHPLLLGMVAYSLEDAIGRPIGWASKLSLD